MSPTDLSPEGQERFARLSKRWAEEASAAPHRADPRVSRPPSKTLARITAFAAAVGTAFQLIGGAHHGA